MATRRTQEQLQALFASGQPAGSITPDRVQDAIYTLRPAYARISVTAPALTVIATENEWTKLAGTTALGAGAFGFSMPEDNRIRCDLELPAITTITAAVSLQGAANTNVDVAIAVNGDIRTTSIQTVRIPTGGDAEGVILADFVSQPGDFFGVWARNTSNASDFTAARLVLRVEAFIL